MNAGRRAEGVAPEDGVVERYRPAATLGSLLAILAQARQVVVNPAHELQVDEQLIHRRVADALADAQGRAVNLIRAALDGRNRVDDAEAAVLMPVPVKSDALALLLDNLLDEADDRARPVGRGVAHGVADADGARAAAYGGRVECADGFGVGARSVLGDEHDGQALACGEGDGLLGELQELVERPALGEEAYEGGAEEGAGLDCDSGALRDFGDGADVVLVRARGAVGPDF